MAIDRVALSIVVPTWNSRANLLNCLRSIYENLTALPFEVILVVNGSTDGTQVAVPARFPEVLLIENERNEGFSRAVNRGLTAASGRYLLLLNDDTVVYPRALEEMAAYLDAHPQAGCVGPQLVDGLGSKQNSIHNHPTVLTEIVPLFLLQTILPNRFPSKRSHYTSALQVPAVLGACMMIRRQALDTVGLLDERFFCYLEETDWHLRARSAGYSTFHLPTVTIYHVHGASSKLRFPGRTKVEYHRSLYRFADKHYGKLSCRLLLLVKWVKLLVNVSFLFVGCLATGFASGRRVRRFRSYLYLLAWHAKGRPDTMGLSTLPLQSVEKQVRKRKREILRPIKAPNRRRIR